VKTLILGIGNLLLRDEGVGVHVVHALLRQKLSPDVVALEAGTAFLDALTELEQADRIFIIDAMHGGEEPGTVYRVPFDECDRPDCIASLHGFDMSRVLFLTGRTSFPEVIVIGIEPAEIAWGIDLSGAVAEAVPAVVSALMSELAETAAA
jgi:hydrogenase maturation protease